MSLVGVLLGYFMIIGSLSIKVPLIQNCIEAKSTKGLPESSLLLEIAAFIIPIFYNLRNGNPFSTWGELLTITGQDLVLLGCIWYYNKAPVKSCIITSAKLTAVVLVMILVPESILPMMPLFGMFVGWSGVIQIIMSNLKQKHTGPLSEGSQGVVVTGGAIRVYTALTQLDDKIIQIGAIIGTSLQVAILIQIMTMRENTRVFRERLMNGDVEEEEEPVDNDISRAEESPLAGIVDTAVFKKLFEHKEISVILDALKSSNAAVTEIRTAIGLELSKFKDKAYDKSEVYRTALYDLTNSTQREVEKALSRGEKAMKKVMKID